jgi:phage terminase large subunit-like protein
MSKPTMKHTAAQALKFAEAAAEHKRTHKRDFFNGYPKQKAFFNLGADTRERMFMAGTQVGKSEAGSFEAACHLTGEYPDDWKGKRFARPVRMWAAGVTSLDVRNIIQRKLCGEPGVTSDFGTGMIPRDRFADKPTMSRGIAEAYDTIQVTHRTNGVVDGISTCHFKSYEQGRQKFQGDTIDVGWADEEADNEIYSEFLSRLRGDGILYTAFTPLLGQTELVQRFMSEGRVDCGVVNMELKDAQHFTTEEKAKRLAGYRSFERDAREKGIPLLGTGLVFADFPEDTILHDRDPASFPEYWPWLAGCDFQHASGSDSAQAHPFGYVLACVDPDADIIYLVREVKIKGSFPLNHANAILNYPAGDAKIAWGHDGARHDFSSGQSIAEIYRRLNLKMLPTWATFPRGGYSFEQGIEAMSASFATGRLLVHKSMVAWREEFRFYHRDGLQVVKVRDDLMSATRVLVMQIRSAQLLDADRHSADFKRKSQTAKYSTWGDGPGEINIFTGRVNEGSDYGL